MSNSKLIERLNYLKSKSEVLRWNQVPADVWFKVCGLSNEFSTKYGTSYILDLENLETGERLRSFTIPRLPNGDFFNTTMNHYIQSLGLKPKKNGEYFYDFAYIPEFVEETTK